MQMFVLSLGAALDVLVEDNVIAVAVAEVKAALRVTGCILHLLGEKELWRESFFAEGFDLRSPMIISKLTCECFPSALAVRTESRC